MEEMSVRQEDYNLVNQFLEFCRHLASKGKTFSISLNMVSSFSFSLDTIEKITTDKIVLKKPFFDEKKHQEKAGLS